MDLKAGTYKGRKRQSKKVKAIIAKMQRALLVRMYPREEPTDKGAE